MKNDPVGRTTALEFAFKTVRQDDPKKVLEAARLYYDFIIGKESKK